MNIFAKNVALTLGTIALIAASFNVAAKSPSQKELEDLARFQSAAGQPMPSLTHMLRTNISWQPLGERNLVYNTSASKSYLLTLEEGCVGLDFAESVVVGRGNNTVHVNTDRVKVIGPTNPSGFDCKITEIRPVDLKKYRALKAAEKNAAKAG